DVTGHARLAAHSELPIAVGEALRNRYEFDTWLTAGAVGLAQPDVGRTGITEALAIAELCAARHVPVAPHHSTGLGIALAAGVQLSAVLPELPYFEYQPTTVRVAATMLRTRLRVTAAEIAVPDGIGLGVEVDEEFVHTHAKEW
ncbi:MAG: enolase C-terminal domain-like protein, partial [Micromonosporaceae bacterium]